MSQMLLEAKEASERVRVLLESDSSVYEKLGEELRKRNPQFGCTIARGSSDHGATYASYLIPLCTGKVVASLPPSLTTVLRAPLDLKNQFALSLSQSGGSPDLLASLKLANEKGAITAAIVNETNSPLAKEAQWLLPQHAGKEKSIAATKTVICTMVAVARLAAVWAQDKKLINGLEKLPNALEEAYKMGCLGEEGVFQNISHVYVLSRGLGLAAAMETALKLKEVGGLQAEAFSTAEVRHGPKEIVNEKFLIVALAIPGSGLEDVIAASNELKAQGAKVFLIAPKKYSPQIELPDLEEGRLSPILALQAIYPWLTKASKFLGRDPDRPRILKEKVVQTI
jgi:glucosamine--fructose-6-phosphate aminotransferase (isomerizing)